MVTCSLPCPNEDGAGVHRRDGLGYGPLGYGPCRTARVIDENPEAAGVLFSAAQRALHNGGQEAFVWLQQHWLYRLGVALATNVGQMRVVRARGS
jgi:hypothetical protein